MQKMLTIACIITIMVQNDTDCRLNKQKFIENVTQSNWSSVCSQSDVNDAYDKFISTIEDSYDKCFPVCQLSRKRLKDNLGLLVPLKILVLLKINYIQEMAVN